MEGKSGPAKVLIVINGALVANTNYLDVAKAVQNASDLKLWVAIPQFIINTPNPAQINSKIKDAIFKLEAAGFPGSIDHGNDVVIAGHSLGGIFGQKAVVTGGYKAMVLFGSYLTSIYGYTVENYPKPVLTLAGEIDGLTRITRIARSFKELQSKIVTSGHEVLYTHPVVTLEGVVHSQFNSNQNVTSFGLKDSCAEVDWATAHARIGSAVSDFMTVVHASGDVDKAKTRLAAGVNYTEELVSGFLKAQKYEADRVCIDAQKRELEKIGAAEKFTVSANKVSRFDFDFAQPHQDGDKITVVQDIIFGLNPGDLSTTDMSAKSVNCKIFTAEKLAITKLGELSVPSASTEATCQESNEASIRLGLSLASKRTMQRYVAIEKHFRAEADSTYSTGLTWELASLKFDDKTSSVNVQSPSLQSHGILLCKYLSLTRTLEYMMVDGLPAFDACKHWS
eukprot:TRINITY_DN8458_c1_g1_i1.p1 TRINITY_DN8458_c1_g1~~TRINITY_DN8458_c1_g1_i1.p1  ORF type:complete len:517 (+),score=67.54 TRINITY_DN8458_c1_g1_i1:197-1552(+)